MLVSNSWMEFALGYRSTLTSFDLVEYDKKIGKSLLRMHSIILKVFYPCQQSISVAFMAPIWQRVLITVNKNDVEHLANNQQGNSMFSWATSELNHAKSLRVEINPSLGTFSEKRANLLGKLDCSLMKNLEI